MGFIKVTLLIGVGLFALDLVNGEDISTRAEDYEPFNALLWLQTYPSNENDTGKVHKWISIQTEKQFIKFSLKACHSGHIGLATVPGDVTSLHYEVVFGESTYGIKDLRTGSYLVEEQGLVLDCDNFKDFWITWTNLSVAVGEGTNLWSNFLLEMDIPEATTTRAVSFTTGEMQYGFWHVHKDMGRLITVNNPPPSEANLPNFRYLWLSFEHELYVIFQVKMCTEARINVSPSRQGTTNSYELRLGTEGNTKTSFHEYASQDKILEVETLNILSCNQYRYFWISRQGNFMEFGVGSRVGDNRLFYYELDRELLNLGFATTDPAGGSWQFRYLTGEYYSVKTIYDNRQYTQVQAVTQQQHTNLMLQACKGAIIVLHTATTTVTENEYLIVIGDLNNQQTTLQQRQGTDGYVIWKISDTSGILDCDVSKPYWVSWYNNTIAFGSGQWNKNETLLEWTPSSDTIAPMQAILLATDDAENSAEWRIGLHSVASLLRRTHGLATFDELWYDVTDTTEFVFSVTACQDAFVKLAKYHGVKDYHTYELQLGVLGNQNVNLLKDHSVVQTMAMTQSLACNYPRQYWVHFEKMDNNQTKISFGNGPYARENTVLEYVDTTGYDVNAVSIATGELHVGNWRFSTVEDNNLVLLTDPVDEYKYGYTAVSNFWFTFSIGSCSHTCFLLSGNTDFNNMANSVSVEFCLGTAENKNSTIRDLSTGETKSYYTPNILACYYYGRYWFEWDNDQISVGRGDLFSNHMLQYTAPNPGTVNIRFVRFKSYYETSALIKIPQESHGLLNLQTSGNNLIPTRNNIRRASSVLPRTMGRKSMAAPIVYSPEYSRFWMTSVTKEYVIFSVVACQEVYVALAPMYLGDHTMEVRIGVENNTMTMIVGFDITRSLPTDQILSCTERRDFWITWSQEEVAVGSGRILGDNRIVVHREPSALYSVHALAFATALNYPGVFEIASQDADNYLLHTRQSEVNPIEIHTRKGHFLFTLMVEAFADIRIQKDTIDFYRIDLGGSEGQSVRLYKRGYLIAEAPNEVYVAYGTQQKFWLTWNNNTISMGKGHTLYKQSFILWIDEDPQDRFMDDITQVILSSSKASGGGYWSFPKYSGNATIYHSPQSSTYYDLRVVTRSITEMVFRVRTCNQALVALSDIPGIITERTLELVIEDGETSLRNGTGGSALVTFPTKGGLLDCNHYRTYWLSWEGYAIRLGAGGVVGDQRFLIYYLPDTSKTVNELAMGTGESRGSWEFSPLSGNVYHVHTTQQFDTSKFHSQMWLTNPKTNIQFAVKATKQARIAMSYKPGDHTRSTYEIVISETGDSNVALYYVTDTGEVRQNTRVSTDGLLDSNNYKNFWISWDTGVIKMGAGQLNSGLLFTMQGTMLTNVYGVSFAAGNETYADWTFLQDYDDSLMIQSREYFYAPDFSLTVAHRTYFIFQVKSCNHAEILLTEEYGNEKLAYQVIIGTDSNQNSYIRQSPGQEEGQVEQSTPGILHCAQYITFWISWKDNEVSFGKGAIQLVDEVMAWQDTGDSPRDVVQAYLNTGNQNIGYWELIDLDGESFTVHTGNSHSYDFVRFTPLYEHVQFRAQACSDVHVALITQDGDQERVHFEIVFGCCSNMKTVIRNESLTYNVARQDTPEILSCNEMRTFWVSWDNGRIQAGFGEAYTHMIVEYQDAPFTVKHVSYSTWDQVTGKFKFSQDLVKDVTVRNRDEGAYSYSQFWRTVMSKSSVSFRVKAPHDVYVILTATPNVVETNAYEIKIGTENNMQTEITKRGGDTAVEQTADVLSDTEMRDFWLQWTDTQISVGTGTVIGENTLVVLQDSEYNINAFSITTQLGVQAEWQFPMDFEVPDTPPPTGTTTSPGQTTTTTSPGQTTTTTSSSGQPTVDAPGSTGLSAGAIVGITFGVLGFLLIAALGVIMFFRLRQLKPYEEFHDEAGESPAGGGNGTTWDNPNYDGGIQLQNTNDPFNLADSSDYSNATYG